MTQRWARVGRNDHVRVCVCACVRVTTRVEGSQPNAPVVEKDPRCFQGLRVCVVPYTSSELVVHEVLELDVLVHGEGLGLLENGHDLLLLHFALQVAWPHTQEKRERSGECCALSDPQNDTDGWIRSSRSGAPSNSCALTFQGRDAVKDHDGLEVPVGFANHPGGPHVSWNFLLHHLIGLAKELVHLDAGGLVGNLALDHTADLAQIEGNGKGGGVGGDAGGSQTRVSRIARVGSSGPRSRWWWMVSPTKIQPSPGFSSGPRPPLRIRLTLLTGISAYALTDCLCALLATTPLRPRDLLVAARTVFESMMMMMGLQVSLGLTSSFSIPRLLPRVRFCPNVSPIFVSFFPLCGLPKVDLDHREPSWIRSIKALEVVEEDKHTRERQCLWALRQYTSFLSFLVAAATLL